MALASQHAFVTALKRDGIVKAEVTASEDVREHGHRHRHGHVSLDGVHWMLAKDLNESSWVIAAKESAEA